MTAPVRIRLSRAKGFDLQAHSRAVNGLPAVNVARPSIFGNPWRVAAPDGALSVSCFVGASQRIRVDVTLWGANLTPERAVRAFRASIGDGPGSDPIEDELLRSMRAKGKNLALDCLRGWRHNVTERMSQLRGKNLACFCALDQPCHADVLLEIANRPICEAV